MRKYLLIIASFRSELHDIRIHIFTKLKTKKETHIHYVLKMQVHAVKHLHPFHDVSSLDQY